MGLKNLVFAAGAAGIGIGRVFVGKECLQVIKGFICSISISPEREQLKKEVAEANVIKTMV